VKSLQESEFLDLVKGATVLTINGGGISVVRTVDEHIVKVFRPPSRFSSDLFSPRPLRFAQAVRDLESMDIPTVRNLEMYWVPCMKRHVAHYLPMPGEELRDVLAGIGNIPGRSGPLIERWAGFLCHLHDKGVYFRGINFSNVLVGTGGEFGLIDVGSVQTRKSSLDPDLRARNFKHPLAYSRDRDSICNFGLDRFISLYLQASSLTADQQARFLAKLVRQHELLAEAAQKVTIAS
jgi:hypothetical protein